MLSHAGACECRSVTYSVTASAIHIYACHCLNCQTRSGSAFAEHAMLDASSFHFEGSTLVRSREADSVRFEEVFCASCLSRIFNRNSVLPDAVFLRAGTFAQSQELEPIAHIWTKRKQRWIVLPEGVPCFEESPTPEQFGAAIREASSGRVEP
jgi:hypothetical protein